MARIGQILGERFRLDGKLGAGGIGEVYKATDLDTGTKVAVKLMSPQAIAEDDGLMTELFWREMPRAQAAGPGAVGFYGRGKEPDGTIYTVMELVEGEDLDKMRLKSPSGKLPVKTVVPVIEQTLETLSKAHKKGVVHRDIKPANLLVTPQGEVKVIDFGMADSVRKPIMPPKEFIGTPGFSPPEQVEGLRTSPKSDVWSVGATAYQALSGKPPVDWRQDIPIQCPVPPLKSVAPNVPDYVADAIDDALECDPRDRPSAEELLTELNPHVHHMMAAQEESMSTGAKLAIGVAVAGLLYGAYQIATGISDVFTSTPVGKWLWALPPGAWEEEERLAQLDMAAVPPGVPQTGEGVVQIDVTQTGTALAWPPGTVFYKYPHGTLTEKSPRKTASGSDEDTSYIDPDLRNTLYVDVFGNQWLSGPNGIVTGFRPVFGVIPGHAYRVGPMRWDGSYDVLSDITLGTPMKTKTAKGPVATY